MLPLLVAMGFTTAAMFWGVFIVAATSLCTTLLHVDSLGWASRYILILLDVFLAAISATWPVDLYFRDDT